MGNNHSKDIINKNEKQELSEPSFILQQDNFLSMELQKLKAETKFDIFHLTEKVKLYEYNQKK